MAYRTDKPLPPIVRLDAANATRLHDVATAYLQLPPAASDFRLDAADRAAMRAEIECQTPPGVTPIPVRTDVSDTYLSARFLGTYERTRVRKDGAHVGSWEPNASGATDPYAPADGMVAGSTVANEVRGNAKQQRTRMNAYLNRARSELQAAPGMRSSFPNPGDVETRAYELAQQDPEGKFPK